MYSSVRSCVRGGLLCLLGASLVACEGEPLPLDREGESSAQDPLARKSDPQVVSALRSGAAVDVIVSFAEDLEPASAGTDPMAAAVATMAQRKAHIARELGIEGLIQRDYSHLNAMHVRVPSMEVLQAITGHSGVVQISANQQYRMLDSVAPNLALIEQPAAATAGYLGAGTTVAVIDSGIDTQRAPFNCTPGADGCAVAYLHDFADGDNSADAAGQPTHGTNVAGVVLSVAPKARVAGLDVFVGESGYTTAILAAINWAIQNKTTYNIVAMNFSLGGGSFAAPCPTAAPNFDPLPAAIDLARQAGILSFVAAGNEGKTDALSSPGCAPAAVSVGAVYDHNIGGISAGFCQDLTTTADKVACFSNSASFLKILAPGVDISAAGITMSGTSQATPHVAGAAAVLRAAFPNESVDAIVARLTTSGQSVKDARNGLTFPRLDLAAALTSAAPTTGQPDGPAGAVLINNGANYTRSTSVTVTSKISSGTPYQICLSEGSACGNWLRYVPNARWTLSSGDGRKTVNVWWKDHDGNVSASAARATITLDTQAPTGGQVSAVVLSKLVSLAWRGFVDSGSGVVRYTLLSGKSGVPASCGAGTVVYSGNKAGYVKSLASGTYYFRLCATDAAGNAATTGPSITVTVK